jgi:WD40 repeat protein
MARILRHSRAIAAALFGLGVLVFAPAFGEDQGPNAGTDLYDRPVLAIDPGMHTAKIQAQAVDADGRYAVTGGDDRTVRVWSVADGKLLRTIWIPVGPENVVGSTRWRSARTDRRSRWRLDGAPQRSMLDLFIRPPVRKPHSADRR